MSAPSHNISMARSSVARTRFSSPTLPPSAISASAMFSIAAAAEDRNPDIVEGGGDRGVWLVDGDADGGDLLETGEHGLGDGAGGGLHQAIALCPERLARNIDHLIVADSVGELVGARGLRQIDVEHEIEVEG